MGPYKKVRRDGKWVTVDANGKVVDRAYRKAKGDKFRKSQREKRKKVIDKLKSRVRNFGERLVYSDQKGPDGKQLTVAQAKKRNLKINKESERKRKNIDAERKQIKININKQRTDSKNKPKPEIKKTEAPKPEIKKTEAPQEKLKVSYRRTKGEGIGKGDTRITKKLKKAGFTETRLAKLREKNAAFQKAKKGGKKAMEAYRKKYPKRG